MDCKEYYKNTPALTAEFCGFDLRKINLDGDEDAADPENAGKIFRGLQNVRKVRENYEFYMCAFKETLPTELETLERNLKNHLTHIAEKQQELHALAMKKIQDEKRANFERNERIRQRWLDENRVAARIAAWNFKDRFNCEDEGFHAYLAAVWQGVSMKDFAEKNILVGSEIHIQLQRPEITSTNALVTNEMYHAGYMLYVIAALYEFKKLTVGVSRQSQTFQGYLMQPEIMQSVYATDLFEPGSLVLGWNSEGYWERIWFIIHALYENSCFRYKKSSRMGSYGPLDDPDRTEMHMTLIAPAMAVVAVLTKHEFVWDEVFEHDHGRYPSWNPPKDEEEPNDDDRLASRIMDMMS